MKIKSIKPIGVRQTYSPEMKSERHNYITENSGAIHANSHAVAYCLVAYKCLYLKAHYPVEWWAAVMSDCHPEKLIRYMGVAKSEGVKFAPININKLTVNFDATGDAVNPGLIGLKRVGMSAAQQFQGTRDYSTIDEFVAANPKSKVVLERLIKLGSFDHLPGHQNRQALWLWYLYRYGSGKEVTAIRKTVQKQLLDRLGWTPEAVQRERERLIHEYKTQFPKRNRVPNSILNWVPKPRDDRETVMSLCPRDYPTAKLLTYEKEYLGYYTSNPLCRYEHCKQFNIAQAKQDIYSPVHAVIMRVEFSVTKKGDEMCRLGIYDGQSDGLVLLWSDDCSKYRKLLGRAEQALTRDTGQGASRSGLKFELGVGMNLQYSPSKRSFTPLRQGESMWQLPFARDLPPQDVPEYDDVAQ